MGIFATCQPHERCYLNAAGSGSHLLSSPLNPKARATLEILIPDFVKQTSEEKPVEGDELEVLPSPVYPRKKTTRGDGRYGDGSF